MTHCTKPACTSLRFTAPTYTKVRVCHCTYSIAQMEEVRGRWCTRSLSWNNKRRCKWLIMQRRRQRCHLMTRTVSCSSNAKKVMHIRTSRKNSQSIIIPALSPQTRRRLSSMAKEAVDYVVVYVFKIVEKFARKISKNPAPLDNCSWWTNLDRMIY